MCALLVGLPDVAVLGVVDDAGRPLRVHVETAVAVTGCAACGSAARVKERAEVALVDLPAFGRAAVLVWHKRRWRCPDRDCEVGSWTEQAPAIAATRARVTDRAGRWVCAQVGRDGRSVAEVARELGCDWHTVMDAVVAYGTPLVDDPARIGDVSALGLDETLFARTGVWRTRSWCTSIVDVSGPSQLLDVVEGRTAKAASAWIDARPEAWRAGIEWATLDLSGPYRKAFSDSLPDAVQVADPFHVVKLANSKLDECRRRVQNETLGHRGRRDDPLYRFRRLLAKGHERLDDKGNEKLVGFLEAGDPRGEVRMCWHAEETLRGFYSHSSTALLPLMRLLRLPLESSHARLVHRTRRLRALQAPVSPASLMGPPVRQWHGTTSPLCQTWGCPRRRGSTMCSSMVRISLRQAGRAPRSSQGWRRPGIAVASLSEISPPSVREDQAALRFRLHDRHWRWRCARRVATAPGRRRRTRSTALRPHAPC
jgi:transposase